VYSEFADLPTTNSSLRGLRCAALHFEAEVVSHHWRRLVDLWDGYARESGRLLL
jgi:hypothetical protein